MPKERYVVMSTRVELGERARVRAVADTDGITVSQLIHRLVMPQVDDRLRRDLATVGSGDDQHGS